MADVSRLVETASLHGINGVVAPLGLDTLSLQKPDYFRRLEQIRRVCERNRVELIPAIFSVGYGDSFLAYDPNLAEGLLVEDAPFLVSGHEAKLAVQDPVRLAKGGFEDCEGASPSGFNDCDQPGEVSFIDSAIKHGGRASLRLENFTANPYGHGRVVQAVSVHPHRCYRVTIWVKAEGLQPSGPFECRR